MAALGSAWGDCRLRVVGAGVAVGNVGSICGLAGDWVGVLFYIWVLAEQVGGKSEVRNPVINSQRDYALQPWVARNEYPGSEEKKRSQPQRGCGLFAFRNALLRGCACAACACFC
jgi:hypothetical protein